MLTASLRRFLGPPPLFHVLFRWLFAVLFSVMAWYLYQWMPIPGLIAIGMAPVVVLFLFFRGLNMLTRTVSYWKTRRLAVRLNMTPTWGSSVGGFLLLDERNGRWIIDGKTGTLDKLTRLRCSIDWLAFRLELYESDDVPVATYGLENAASLNTAALRFQDAATLLTGNTPPLDVHDARQDEASGTAQQCTCRNEEKREEEGNLSLRAS